MTKEKIPEIDLDELKKFKEQNFKQRLEFIDSYVKWLKKKSDKQWSKEQKVLIDSQIQDD